MHSTFLASEVHRHLLHCASQTIERSVTPQLLTSMQLPTASMGETFRADRKIGSNKKGSGAETQVATEMFMAQNTGFMSSKTLRCDVFGLTDGVSGAHASIAAAEFVGLYAWKVSRVCLARLLEMRSKSVPLISDASRVCKAEQLQVHTCLGKLVVPLNAQKMLDLGKCSISWKEKLQSIVHHLPGLNSGVVDINAPPKEASAAAPLMDASAPHQHHHQAHSLRLRHPVPPQVPLVMLPQTLWCPLWGERALMMLLHPAELDPRHQQRPSPRRRGPRRDPLHSRRKASR